MSFIKTSKHTIEELVEEFEQELYWYLRKILISHDTTKDILQEVFIRAWCNLDKFRGDSSVSTWLYRIAHNEAMRFINKENKRLKGTGISLEDDLLNKLSSTDNISGDEIQMKLQKAILSLPLTQREVFTMRYFDEMKYDKIADILDISVNSLKVSYHHAKNKIEELIKS